MERKKDMNPFWTYTQFTETLEDASFSFVSIIDIAHSLSQTCRFLGHPPFFYSVAEHSLLVMKAMDLFKTEITPRLKLGALLHDAEECYVGDIIRPVRRWLKEQDSRNLSCSFDLSWFYHHFTKMIHKRFELSYTIPELRMITMADDFLLDVEGSKFFAETWISKEHQRTLIQSWKDLIKYYEPKKVEQLYLKEFEHVYKRYVAERKMAARTDQGSVSS